VFGDGDGCVAVVEAKPIDLDRAVPPARSQRTDSRGKVIEHARRYAVFAVNPYAARAPARAFAHTDERVDRMIEVVLAVDNGG
jgi:hypothetical protein